MLAGAVLDAVHDELFTAARGGGAHRNGRPIQPSDETDVSQALVATGFGYAPERRQAQAEVLVKLLPAIRDIRRMGAAAVDLCSVACGRVDAFYERGLSWWDLAAGSLIASEAGATVSSLHGGPIEAGSVFAAANGISTPLRELLGALGAHDVP
jgi:myo-inositol-1(or 4)-monophosphatase